MAYRGRDLDLRLPHDYVDRPARGAETHGRQQPNYESDDSFVVDDTVLACFNHAYDIAAAHRAGEVRIAHLLLAATRITETADALQARGVHVPGLMRETAAIVASQFPVNAGNGHDAPRASRELEDVLRHATSYAGRQQHPINSNDLVDVLFEMRSEVAGIELLDRNAGRVETRGHSNVRETPRERIRMPASGAHYGTRQAPSRTSIPGSPTDSIQNSRLDALEQMVRALGTDLANERRTFSEVLQGLQQDAHPVADPPPYVEYEPYPASPPSQQPPYGEESYVETAVPQPIYDAGLADRIEAVMQEMTQLNLRLGKIEVQLSRYADTGGDMDMGPVVDRLESLEGVIREIQKDRSHDVSDVADRISDLETLIADRGSIDVDFKPLVERLDVIEEAVVNGEGGGFDTTELLKATANLGSDVKALDGRLASQVSANERNLTVVGERLEKLAQDAVAQRVDIKTSHDELKTLLDAEIARDREDTSEFVHEVGQVHDALMKLNANQHTLAGSIDTWRDAGAREMSLISTRMDTVVAEASRPMQLLETMSANMEGMYRATVERHARRNRLWYWLFGTDDWVTASWPSAAARVEADRPNVDA